jgi:hypothetical protein
MRRPCLTRAVAPLEKKVLTLMMMMMMMMMI